MTLQRTDRCRSAAPGVPSPAYDQQADERRDTDDHGRYAQPERGDDDGEHEAGKRGGDPEAVSPRRPDQSGLQRAQPPDLVPTAYVQAQTARDGVEVVRAQEVDEERGHDDEEKEPVDGQVVEDVRSRAVPAREAVEAGYVPVVERQEGEIPEADHDDPARHGPQRFAPGSWPAGGRDEKDRRARGRRTSGSPTC